MGFWGYRMVPGCSIMVTTKTAPEVACNELPEPHDSLDVPKEPLMPKDNLGSSPLQSPTPKRKSTGKRLRFEIFKRDNFACQYCGAQPPDVVLVVDHVQPVAAGGTNGPLNLITACEACNQGKADKPLGDRIVRPDADLMYLETQQEVAELNRYKVSLRNRIDAALDILKDLRDLWMLNEYSGYEPPKWFDETLTQMLLDYDPEIVERAMTNVARKVAGGYLGYGRDTAKYLRAVARNMAAEGGE